MYILYLGLALLILLLMVTIHEFGHYIAGKLLGFKINEFSIGFGKALFSKKRKSGEVFSIRLVPLGGYCAFEGEEEDSDNEGAFMKQKPWKRLIVLFSGAFFNFVSAIIFTVMLLCITGYDIPQVYKVKDTVAINEQVLLLDDKITQINGINIDLDDNENTVDIINASDLGEYISKNISDYDPLGISVTYRRNGVEQTAILSFTPNNNNYVNETNGLKPDDVIYKVNGKEISFISNQLFSDMISENSKDASVTLTVKRNGELVDVKCNYLNYGIPYLTYKNTQNNSIISYRQYDKLSAEEQALYQVDGYKYAKAIGVESGSYKFTFGEAIENAVPYTFGFAWKVLESLGLLITGQLGLSAVGGPITTITTMANFTQSNFSTFFVLLPLIAANLAVFNWLPFPALDGSKMLFTVIEMIRGKPINPKVENTIHTVGLIILFAFVIIADAYHLILG